MSSQRLSLLITAVLLPAVLVSALLLVHGRHETRALFVELNELSRERDELDTEWSRLQIEQGVWATYGRIERVATTRLDMTIPNRNSVVVLVLDHSN